MFKKAFNRWKVIAHKIGEFQSRLLLSIFYFVVFAPFAIGLKLFSDPLRIKTSHGWLTRDDDAGSATESSRRQF